jgi:hypothetical protein
MFGEVIVRREPLSCEAFSAGPDFSALATSLETGSLAVLHSFTVRRADAPGARQGRPCHSCVVTRLPSAVSGWPTVA